MPSDERDQQFERALQRHLRGSSAAGCPDAETLAAYHERTLALEDMAQWKEHVVSCARCQETLALLEETNSVALHEWEEKTAAAQSHGIDLEATGMALSRSSEESALLRAAAPQASGTRVESLPRVIQAGARWKWMAPLGVLAAGLLVFVALRERRPEMTVPTPASEIAQNREPAVPAPQAMQQQEPQPSMEQNEFKRLSRTGRSEDAKTANPPGPVNKGDERKKLGPPRKQMHPQTTNDAGLAASGQTETSAYSDAVTSQRAEVQSASPKPSPEQAQSTAELSAGVVAPAPQQSSGSQRAPAAGAMSTLKKETDNEARKAKSATNDTLLFQAMGSTTKSANVSVNEYGLRQIASRDSQVILAGDGKYAWHVGASGKIEASTDAGRVWNLQVSGVVIDLTAGSAPSEKVCWVVGKAGTVLMTGDGGAHWKKIVSPISDDLGGVHATDEDHATIWNLSNRTSYATADGGLTWTQVANE